MKTVGTDNPIDINTRDDILTKLNLETYINSDAERCRRMNGELLRLMDEQVLNALSDRTCIEQIEARSSELATLFKYIQNLNGMFDYGEVPSIEDFAVVKQQYVGADAKVRRPLVKYVPVHILKPFQTMQQSFDVFLRKHPHYVGEHGRPGLIIMSGYRSPYYQLALMARTLLVNGVDRTLRTMVLPGANSDHTDYQNCALDITNIGDIQGSQTHADGRPVDFGETIEGQWLVANAPDFAFYHPYPPKLNSPMDELGPNGIVPEPWHIKYVSTAEDAQLLTSMIGSQQAFDARLRALGAGSLL